MLAVPVRYILEHLLDLVFVLLTNMPPKKRSNVAGSSPPALYSFSLYSASPIHLPIYWFSRQGTAHLRKKKPVYVYSDIEEMWVLVT
jgi:hypothetical protein